MGHSTAVKSPTRERRGPGKDGARRSGGLEGTVRPPGLVRRKVQLLLRVSLGACERGVKERGRGVKIT